MKIRTGLECRKHRLPGVALAAILGWSGVYAQQSATPTQPRPAMLSAHASGRTAAGARKVLALKGDTLVEIAKRWNVAQETMVMLNGLASDVELEEGREVLIPAPPAVKSRSKEKRTAIEPSKTEEIAGAQLTLTDKSVIQADQVWEDSRGYWYLRQGVAHFIEKDRVKIGPAEIARAEVEEKSDVQSDQAEPNTEVPSIWIYLVGGAKVEVDEVNETSSGAWYKRDGLSIFLEKSRIAKIERESLVAAANSKSKRRWAERGWSTGNSRLDSLIRTNGTRFGVDPYLIFCVMEQESHFNARAVSPVGASGLMQLMPGTARRFGVRRVFDAAENIMGGTRYLKTLLGSFNGRVDLVLAGYNAGEGAVARYGGRVPPYRETRNYVKKISKRYDRLKPEPASETVAKDLANGRSLR